MSINSQFHELPIPPHFDPAKTGEVWRVPYQERADQARQWASRFQLPPAAHDGFKIALVAVDVQNTFCIPGFELFVGGRSGMGAVEDNRRLVEFIYRNLGAITQVIPTMDTHQAMQIFHPLILVDADGNPPAPYTLVTPADVASGRWRINPAAAEMLGIEAEYGQRHLVHYTDSLKQSGKYDLTIWPYHAMLGGIGHALVSAVEEAIYFHTIARYSQPLFEVKGQNPFTEHYSAVRPEVLDGPDGELIASKDSAFMRKLIEFDALIIAGQAKSHCVAWTIEDILEDLAKFAAQTGENLAERVYLLEDCASPVVIPGVVDYTDAADAAYRKFAETGAHIVRSTEPLADWPGLMGR